MNPESIDDLQRFLDELEALGSAQDTTSGKQVLYRSVASEDVIEDSLPSEEIIFEEILEPTLEEPEIPRDFQPSRSCPVVAVDCGIVRLGETEDGLIIALRSTIVIDQENDSKIKLFRTGPIYLHNRYKLHTLHQMGEYFGKPDFFVKLDGTDPENVHPIRIKEGIANNAHQYGDRFRNWLERMTQMIAVTSVENGIILFDGALTLRTYDTPEYYLERLAELASSKGNAIVAISKQSTLQVQEKPIRFWLDDNPNQCCYRWLSPLMERESGERILGNMYAARFSVLGPAFRMDVKPVKGQSDDEAIGQFYSSSLMRGGYPDILVRAHAHSYFTSPDVIQLQAQANAKYGLTPKRDIELTGIFAPFGGRYK